MTNPNSSNIHCIDLDAEIEKYRLLGYQLDMIFPADAPREALMSEPPAVAGGLVQPPPTSNCQDHPGQIKLVSSTAHGQPPATAGGSDWVRGRAGMEYRDLIHDRLGGRMIASHIRLRNGGEVPDYVHFHKIDFQMIYCKHGRIRVVYEDQGPPFWLETGDCVLQPPEIRHRVLECTAGAEVVEVSTPAEHQTWVEHNIALPTAELRPDRDFGGQRFVHHVASAAKWDTDTAGDREFRDTGISAATRGLASVRVVRPASVRPMSLSNEIGSGKIRFLFILTGTAVVIADGEKTSTLAGEGGYVVPFGEDLVVEGLDGCQILEVVL